MKKNLFLTCALALASVVGVSAQGWFRTVACGQGEAMKTEGGAAMHKGETPLIQNPGATGVRFTVIETAPNSEIKGGGPCFALGEFQILDANGNPLSYEVTSNADHNTMGGAGSDGQGLPALSDGTIEQGNYWHSTWSAAAPADFHYLEFTFTDGAVDAYQLVWYTRPGSDKNNPTVVGLTNPGNIFTADMCYQEFNFSVGSKAAAIDPAKFYVIKSNSPVVFNEYNRETGEVSTTYEDGVGPRYMNAVGNGAEEASPASIVRFIPAGGGKYLIQWAISASYLGAGSYNGANGTASQTTNLYSAVPVTVEENSGNFNFSYQAVYNGEVVDFFIGADPRSANNGRMMILDETHKDENIERGWCEGFSLPLEFDYTIYEANVAEGVLPELSIDVNVAAEKMFASTIEKAELYYDMYVAQPDTIWESLGLNDGYNEYYSEWWTEVIEGYEAEISDFAANIAALKEAVENPEDFNSLYEMKMNVNAELGFTDIALIKYDWYEIFINEITSNDEDKKLSAYRISNDYTPGTYSEQRATELLDAFEAVGIAIFEATTVAAIEGQYASLDAAIAAFVASKIRVSTFPEIVENINPANFPFANLPNNAVWKQDVMLAKPLEGIRLTFLANTVGSAGGGGLYGGYPMIALGEFKLYDADGNQVELTADNFYANYTEQNEGFESTVARLCDGAEAGAGSYYHSPWSGTQPSEYIYIDVTFPEEMNIFSFEVYSRDKSTTGGKVSLFPTKVAMTEKGMAYDPVIFAPYEWNEEVASQVTSVDQITDEGIYVLRGMLYENENAGAVDADGNALTPNSQYFAGITPAHNNQKAVRANYAYLIRKVAGTDKFTIYSLGETQYWATSSENGAYISMTTEEAKAAKVNIVAAESELENTFVIYEYQEGRTTTSTVLDPEGAEVEQDFDTPYSVYMHWAGGVAARPTVDPQPGVGANVPYNDREGDAYCFNKMNGEGEWQIYKLNMSNKDYYWMTRLLDLPEALGVVAGSDPGCVNVTEEYEAAFGAAAEFVAEGNIDNAVAKTHVSAMLAQVASLNASKNPMREGIFQIVSANAQFKEKQDVEKALYATINPDGTASFGWKNIEDGNKEFCFEFKKSENSEVAEENADAVYTIRAIATDEFETPYYVGAAGEQSVQIDLVAEESYQYVVKNVAGAAFSIGYYSNPTSWCLHTNGHSAGAGVSGNVVYWNADAGASQWYLREVDADFTSIDDLVTEGTEVVSVAYYTTAGAAIPAPAKGINIVVTTYANGVVEAKKVLVK